VDAAFLQGDAKCLVAKGLHPCRSRCPVDRLASCPRRFQRTTRSVTSTRRRDVELESRTVELVAVARPPALSCSATCFGPRMGVVDVG
jgi:hypothetical protein